MLVFVAHTLVELPAGGKVYVTDAAAVASESGKLIRQLALTQ
jgi:hypothetical protein